MTPITTILMVIMEKPEGENIILDQDTSPCKLTLTLFDSTIEGNDLQIKWTIKVYSFQGVDSLSISNWITQSIIYS